MNKIVIPAIIAALVVIGAAFAVVPFQQASTFHNASIDNLGKLFCDFLHPGGNTHYSPATHSCIA